MTTDNELATVEVRCIPDNFNAVAGVLNTKKARFDIETKSIGETPKRTPLNLVLVLDRSGSMEADNKLTFAKRAVASVLNLLHDDDIVHLVAYDTDVSIVFENARASTRQYLYPVVEQIKTGGSTNMSGGMETGAGLLDKYVHDGFSRRMFVFSDGQANVGKKTRAELTDIVTGFNNKGIITDSFGIGADFDGEIMKGIADAGGSRFFFLESAQVIEPFVTKALMSVFGVCGSQARLIIRGKNGAVVTKIWGHENIVAGASLGDLHANNLRSVLCEFTTSGTANANGTEVETLTYELRYSRPNDSNGTPTVINNTLFLKFVEDESLVLEIDPRVKTMYATQTAADMDARIAQLVKDRKIKEALDLVTEQIALLKDVERFDDERGIIALLIRMAENMHNKLKDDNVDKNLVWQGYEHQCYLKRQNSCEFMALYD
jgi:Ca-activated chloride channel family protein